jgi:hypothetical protein
MVGALAKVPLDTLSLISNEVPPPQNSFNLRWAYVAEIYRGAGSEGGTCHTFRNSSYAAV